jgi:hypothetical protein
MRYRLIELLNDAEIGVNAHILADHLKQESIEAVADHLLAAGVIVPKVKIGDKLYELSSSKTKLYECTVTYFEVGDNDIAIWGEKQPWEEELWICNQSELGNHERIYLTKEEAERALAERREG